MTKKSRKTGKSQSKSVRARRQPSKPRNQPPPPDPRALERMTRDLARSLQGRDFESVEDAQAFLDGLMSEHEGKVPRYEPATALDEAQDLMYEAWDTDDPLARIRFALKALHICRDCADAYVLLAEDAALDLDQARDLYAEGVAAGERALGVELFEKEAGDFWGLVETRPYMRARAGLAHTLWEQDQREQALSHFQELLRLNPNDNQGIRYVLATHLLQMNRDRELEQIFERYPDDRGPDLAYPRALYEFRRGGDSEDAAERLDQAIERNPYVPQYLLGRKRLPKEMPDYVTAGREDEAAGYAWAGIESWRATPGALEWLDRHLAEHYRPKPASA